MINNLKDIFILGETSTNKVLKNTIVITTYYQVKGLEADCVILLNFNDFYVI